MSPGDGPRGTAQVALLSVGVPIGAAEGDAGGIVMEFIERDVEGADGLCGHRQGQTGDIGQKQAVEGPTDAVVVEMGDFFGGQSQQIGSVLLGPFPHPVQRLAGEQQVAHQSHQRLRRGRPRAAILSRQVRAEVFLQAHPLQQMVDDRQRTHAVGTQGSLIAAGETSCRGFAVGGLSCSHTSSSVELPAAQRPLPIKREYKNATERNVPSTKFVKVTKSARRLMFWRCIPPTEGAEVLRLSPLQKRGRRRGIIVAEKVAALQLAIGVWQPAAAIGASLKRRRASRRRDTCPERDGDQDNAAIRSRAAHSFSIPD